MCDTPYVEVVTTACARMECTGLDLLCMLDFDLIETETPLG